MEKKIIDLSKSIHDICKEYPEVVQIMSGLGFVEVTKPEKMATIGRVITIPKGAELMRVDLESIVATLRDHGFEVKRKGEA